MRRTIYTSKLSALFPGSTTTANTIRGKEAQTTRDHDRELSDWRVGAEFIEINRLVLVALDKVSKGSWQPRIGLLSQHKIDSSSTPFES